MVVFLYFGPLGVAVGIGQLSLDVDSIVEALDSGEVINFGEPLFSSLVGDASWAVKPTLCICRKYSIGGPSIRPVGYW